MDFEDIILEKKDGIATVVINRPEVRNAFREKTIEELIAVFKEIRLDGSIGVAVLRGAGDKAFCAGGDMSLVLGSMGKEGSSMEVFNAKLIELYTVIRNLIIPVIAAVNGYAIGGGNELQLWCDLAIATEKSKFGQTGPMVGGMPYLATNLLPRLVGERKTKEIVFLCRQFTAKEAEELGWINKVVPEEKFEEEIDEWCNRILDMSPTSLKIAKVSINFGSDLLYPSLTHAAHMVADYFRTEEQKEGPAAFLEKRKPNFRKFRK